MDYVKQLQERIEALRKSGLTKAEIARRAEVEPMTVHRLQHGKLKTVTVGTYARIMGVVSN